MKMKIAAFVDREGNALPINSEGNVHIYEIWDANWDCVDQVPLRIDEKMSLPEIRQSIRQIAFPLDGCIALIVNRCKGICNAIFEEELHMRIFLATGNPLAVLFQVRDAVRMQIIRSIQRIEQQNMLRDIIAPIPVGGFESGCYQMNLVERKETEETIDSKEILLPFFQNEKFVELEIVCRQVPKWVETELIKFQLEVNIELRKDGVCHVFVRPKQQQPG
jgi:Fe-only nitrogenase accessory protein AnfO